MNTSGHAARRGRRHARPTARRSTLHFATALDDGAWVVEVRPRRRADRPGRRTCAPASVSTLPDGVRADVLGRPHPAGQRRLWRARVAVDGGVAAYLARVGRPIRYGYVPRPYPLAAYQTVFAREPGSAEMPSAGRPFTAELVTDLVTRGVGVAPITLHTGVSSQEAGEPPQPERFRVPRADRAAGQHRPAPGAAGSSRSARRSPARSSRPPTRDGVVRARRGLDRPRARPAPPGPGRRAGWSPAGTRRARRTCDLLRGGRRAPSWSSGPTPRRVRAALPLARVRRQLPAAALTLRRSAASSASCSRPLLAAALPGVHAVDAVERR